MDVLSALSGFFGGVAGYGLPFLFVLGVVIIIHELGHYWAARSVGVKSEVFSVGFGPELFAFVDRRGTRWRLALIPLGGYVKFLGDDDASSSTVSADALSRLTDDERRHSFPAQNVARRSWIVFAGPLANFILAIVVFAALFMSVGKEVLAPRVDAVLPGSAAEAAGIKSGDLFLSADGKNVNSFQELQRIISINAGNAIPVTLERGGAEVKLTVTPVLKEQKTPFGVQRSGVLGVSRSAQPTDVRYEKYGLVDAARLAVAETWFIVERTGAYISGLIMGTEKADQLSGPIRIAQISGELASYGFAPLIQLTALLSVSIGLLNLLPVPMLDGGHLVFYALEALRGKPVSERVQEWSFRAGFALVICLMLFATWNDILHLLSL